MKLLLGHRDLESAYTRLEYGKVVDSWIESRPPFGQRVCLRVRPPGQVIRLAYSSAVVFYLDDRGAFGIATLHRGDSLAQIEEFAARFKEALSDQATWYAIAEARRRASRLAAEGKA